MTKKVRKSIRLNGKLVTETFKNKESATAWYTQLHSKKIMENYGLAMPAPKEGVLFKDFALGDFMDYRRSNYPESTWAADLQRLNSHVTPAFGNMQIARITPVHVRALLQSLVTEKRLSPKTRDRVRALISSLFSHALNRKEPLVSHNPTFGLSFNQGRRTGVKLPSFLRTHKESVRYLKAAAAISPMHFAVGCLGLMGGLRKQEMIAVRFGHFDFDSHELRVSEKYVQVSGEIVPGTKSGSAEVRYVPLSKEFEAAIKKIRAKSSDGDFVLHNPDGSHMSPRQVYTLNQQTCARAEVDVSVHGLRHTFGREFAERSGNVKALQAILGHSNSSVTDLYSQLSGSRLSGFRDVVSFDFEGQ